MAGKIRWRLREVMARYQITGESLANELGVSAESISKWRTRNTMPRISGEKIENLTEALTKLSGVEISFSDLYEENFNLAIA